MRGEGDGGVGGLGLVFFLLCRASELFAYDDTEFVHPEFCSTRRLLSFRQDSLMLSWQDRDRADRVEVHFVRLRETRHSEEKISYERGYPRQTRPAGRGNLGGVEIIFERLRRHPSLPMDAPLTT